MASLSATVVTWLHVSDFHFKTGEFPDRDIVLNALLEKVGTVSSGGEWKPDFIFCTGDIAHSGKPEEYRYAANFFDQLLSAVNLEKKHLFTVPGNHDVDLNKIGDWHDISIDNHEQSNNFFRPENRGRLRKFLEKFHGYQGFCQDYLERPFDESSDYFCELIEVGKFRIAVIGLNSAWLARGGDSDTNRLILGELPLHMAFEELKKKEAGDRSDLRILMFHHPLRWLKGWEFNPVSNILKQHADLVLQGHDDETNGWKLPTNSGTRQVLFLQQAPVWDSQWPKRVYFARYEILSDGSTDVVVYPLKYSSSGGRHNWLLDSEAFTNADEVDKFQYFHFGLGTAHRIPPLVAVHWHSVITPVTSETLQEEEQKGKDILQEIERLRKTFGTSSREYIEYCNSESFIGHLPQWRHLYMGAFGAFPRPKKETQLLEVLDKNIQRLSQRANGLLFHIISGDSGTGKSALAKLVIRRLCAKQDLEEFPRLLEAVSRLKIFEIKKIEDWDILENALKASLQPSPETEEPIFLLFVDDLFAELEREDVRRLFGILHTISESSKIYFLATSPSWLFSRQRDLQMYRQDFELVDSVDTLIGGLDPEDRDSLKAQYLEMWGEKYRPDLIKVIENENDIILIKLALHQNQHYSEYLERTFAALEREGLQRYLVALLLSSTLSRFYVHFPVTLIQEFNREFSLSPADSLPELASDYESFAVQRFRLFRIRRGTRSLSKITGLPDTIAPLHDRIAQVIHSTWGNSDVPLLGLKLWDLGNKVYEKLNKLPETRPILANICRGMLRVAEDSELQYFVKNFGPVPEGQTEWMLLDSPEATYRWITYTRYDLGRTEGFRRYWEGILRQMSEQATERATLAYLVLVLLSPRGVTHFRVPTRLSGMSKIGEEYFPILYEILNTLLTSLPASKESLTTYLSELGNWLSNLPPMDPELLSRRYQVVSSLARTYFGQVETEKQLQKALAGVVKNYLINIGNEYKTTGVLKAGLLLRIRWDSALRSEEIAEIAEALEQYIEDERNEYYRPILYERLLDFIIFGKLREPSAKRLFELFCKVCTEESDFAGITFTTHRFMDYLKGLSMWDPSQYESLMEEMKTSLLSGKLPHVTRGGAYPDLVERLLKHFTYKGYKIAEIDLWGLLKPLVKSEFKSKKYTQPIKFAFRKANELRLPELRMVCDSVQEDAERETRLCLARAVNLDLESAIADFLSLLEANKIVLPTIVCTLLNDFFNHLRISRRVRPPDELIQDCRKRLYTWLHQNSDCEGAESVFILACNPWLFDPRELKGCEQLARQAIQELGIIPIQYFRWWLQDEVGQVGSEQRDSLLDAYLNHLLHSPIAKEGASKKSERESRIDGFIQELLTRYGIERNETWWGKAVAQIVEYYRRLIPNYSKPLGRRGKPVDDKRFVVNKKKRDRCERFINRILSSFAAVRDRLGGSFRQVVEEALAPYKTQLWAQSWMSVFDLESDVDGTLLLISNLESVEVRPDFAVSDYIHWWFDWLQRSGLEHRSELEKIWEWLNSHQHRSVAVFVVHDLLELPMETKGVFEWGSLVKNALKIDDPLVGFSSKSRLVGRYLGWLLKVSDKSDQFENRDKRREELKEVLGWFAKEVRGQEDTTAAAYGGQEFFQAVLRYDLDFNLAEAEDTFFAILESLADRPEGGYLTSYYFSWLSHQQRQIEMAKYMDWINSHSRRRQTPYIFAQLLKSFITSCEFTTSEMQLFWQTLKLLIIGRLDSEGTTVASAHFHKYVAKFHEVSPYIQDELDKISEEFYNICLQMAVHPRIFYLVPSAPFWHDFVAHPLPGHLLDLWRILQQKYVMVWQRPHKQREPKERLYEQTEAFANLTRRLDRLLQTKEESLCQELYDELINFIKSNPRDPISPKHVSILIEVGYHGSELPEVLLNLVKFQHDLKDTSWAISRYFEKLFPNLPEEDVSKHEESLLEVLEENLTKPYFGDCLLILVDNCDINKHYRQITRLIEIYLERTGNFEQAERILSVYAGKVQQVEGLLYEEANQRFLAAIQTNLWRLILHRDSASWKDILNTRSLFQEIQRLVGSEIFLSPNITMDSVWQHLEERGEIGLLMIQRQLREELASSRNEEWQQCASCKRWQRTTFQPGKGPFYCSQCKETYEAGQSQRPQL